MYDITYLTSIAKLSSMASHWVVSTSRVWEVRRTSWSRSAKVVVRGILTGRGSRSLSMRRARCSRLAILADSWKGPSFTVPTMTLVGCRGCTSTL